MAMDKEKLLAHFQAHYLSRQEALFKLPLNYSIDQFWPELLNRRKAGAVILPLYNATGMPYWYTLTGKMVTASERLCEEAIVQESTFDPYRVEMTSAMTEEMFFTSFVEGAQIPLQEAMDFLARGTEPESVQEQMIWNNRHAWSEMVGGIYRPLDEAFVKGLAWMLTEEMDGCAEDYRQADNHPIAAMNNESYDLPPAYILPERMNQYYSFLGAPDVHPLIKAAMAQAYLLAIRPFPEGNERLSRMMSSAVLLRCGYDFFRDISISSAIARESYRYYKAMCDILRPENGGDMTYFMEYYLELLVRAVDFRRERLRRRDEENLARERELAREPLTAAAVSPPPPAGRPPAQEAETPSPDEVGMDEDDGMVVGEHLPAAKFMAEIDKLKHSPSPVTRRTPGIVREMLNNGEYTFTVLEWAQRTGQDAKNADYHCRQLFLKGLLDRDKRGPIMTYTFRVIANHEESADPPDDQEDSNRPAAVSENSPVYNRLRNWVASNSLSETVFKRNAADFFRKMLDEGQTRFSSWDLVVRLNMSKVQAKNVCDCLRRRKLIHNTTPDAKAAVFELIPDDNVMAPPPQPYPHAITAVNGSAEHAPDHDSLKRMFECMLYSKSEVIRIAAETVIRLLREDRMTFLRADWPRLTGLPQNRANDTCDVMLERGVITNMNPGSYPAKYRINVVLPAQGGDSQKKPASDPVIEPSVPNRTSVQERRITQFICEKNSEGQTRFSADEWQQRFSLTHSGYNSDIRKAVAMGLISSVGMTKDHFNIYEINPAPINGVRDQGLTYGQKQVLGSIYILFGIRPFTLHQCSERLQLKQTAVRYHLDQFVDRNIISAQRDGTAPYVYTLLVKPQTHPGCFALRQAATAMEGAGQAPIAAAAAGY